MSHEYTVKSDHTINGIVIFELSDSVDMHSDNDTHHTIEVVD